ncbi:MAG: peptidoglycan-binding protein [Thermoleophilaceae bacterium]
MIDRDLGSRELWRSSLERSRRRRVLAEDARRDIARRKTASVAVSAAVAATPMWPGVTAAADLSKDHVGKVAKKLENRHVDRILLTEGDTGSSVVQLQRALHIADDGIFGPQTNWAVETFQKQHGMDATGEVNVRTWLSLFPTDMIVYAPSGTASALGVNDSGGSQWAALKAPEGDTGQADAQAAGAGRSHGKGHGDTIARAAAVLGEQGDAPGLAPEGVQGPGQLGGAPVPGIVPVQPAPGHGPSAPAPPPTFNFPKGGTVGDMIAAMMSAARQIDRRHYAYSWGGGHNASFSGPYDCSGAVSAVLHAAGLLNSPRVSGGFMHWGAPGPGAVTIYANAGHVYMSILGHYFGTTHANPGGGAGWFKGGPRPGFAVVHVPFSQLHLRRHRKHHRHVHQRQRRAAYRSWGGGATAGGGTAQPPAQPQQQQSASAPAPATSSSGSQPASSTAPAPAPVPTRQAVSSGGTGTQPVQQAPATQPVAPAPAPTVSSQGSGSTGTVSGQSGTSAPPAPTGQAGSGSGTSAAPAPQPADSGSTAAQPPADPAPAPPSGQDAVPVPAAQGSQGKGPAAAPSGPGAGPGQPGQTAGKED